MSSKPVSEHVLISESVNTCYCQKPIMHSLGKSSEVMNDFDSTCHIHRTDGVSTHSVVFILYMESS